VLCRFTIKKKLEHYDGVAVNDQTQSKRLVHAKDAVRFAAKRGRERAIGGAGHLRIHRVAAHGQAGNV
jgi:hypothetical protein